MKSVLTKSGIDTDISKAHSICSAAVSSAANAGVTTNVQQTAVFQKFYYKTERRSSFGATVSCQPWEN